MSLPPLRILHVLHDFLPRHRAGSEIYAEALCRALTRRGHRPVVLCAEVDAALAHGRIRWRDWRGLTVAEVVNNWAFASFDESWASPRLEAQIAGVLDATQPHVVHVHNLLNLSLGLPGIARRRGLPVVATLHDYTLVCPSGGQRVHAAEQHVCHRIDPDRCARCFQQSPFQTQLAVGRLGRRTGARVLAGAAAVLRRHAPGLIGPLVRSARHLPTQALTASAIDRRLAAARRVFDDVDLFVAPSPHLAGEFSALGVPSGKIVVSDYGFEPLPPPRPSSGLHPRPLRVGYVGTLVWHKGVHVLVEAMRRLHSAGAHAHVFGDERVFPEYAASLRARARGLPVTFEGPFERDHVAEIYARLDVLVVPSLWLENSPLVVHEAFMSGVPVIGARIGGLTNLVDHEVNGLLVEPGSAEALAEALGRLRDEPALLHALGAARTPVKSIDDDAREWEARYRHLAAGAPPRSEAAS